MEYRYFMPGQIYLIISEMNHYFHENRNEQTLSKPNFMQVIILHFYRMIYVEVLEIGASKGIYGDTKSMSIQDC